MQKKKRQTKYAAAVAQQEAADDDRLELVKAAAWAWHQHSSSSVSKLQEGHREFPSARSGQRSSSHGPSRYRLESLSSTASRPVAGKNMPIALLDVYETERITRELERLVATGEKRDKIQGKKKNKGGSLLGRHAVKICGSSTNDPVAEIEPLVGRHHESLTSAVLLQRRRVCKKIA